MCITQTKKEHIAVVGLNEVGISLALWAANHEYNVTGFVTNKSEHYQLQKQDPFTDTELNKRFLRSPIRLSENFEEIRGADIIVLCPPPHLPDSSSSFSHQHTEATKQLCRKILPYIREDHLIILQSVMHGGISISEICKELENNAGELRLGTDFYLTYFPQSVPSKYSFEKETAAAHIK